MDGYVGVCGYGMRVASAAPRFVLRKKRERCVLDGIGQGGRSRDKKKVSRIEAAGGGFPS